MFGCREKVARGVADDACADLESNPPNPPFVRVPFQLHLLSQFNSTLLQSGHKFAAGAAGTVSETIDMAVEPENDFISDTIADTGALLDPMPAPPTTRILLVDLTLV